MKKTKKVKNPAAVALGQKGGVNTYEKYGSSHYRKIAKEAWAKRKLSPTL